MRIGSASGIAGHGDFSLICPVPDGETLPILKLNVAIDIIIHKERNLP